MRLQEVVEGKQLLPVPRQPWGFRLSGGEEAFERVFGCAPLRYDLHRRTGYTACRGYGTHSEPEARLQSSLRTSSAMLAATHSAASRTVSRARCA